MENVIGTYLEKNTIESDYSPSDFYLDAVIGIFGSFTIDGLLDIHEALQIWKEVDRFLISAPVYNSAVISKGMSSWEFILKDKGIHSANFILKY